MKWLITILVLVVIGCSISYNPCDTKIEGMVNAECISKELNNRNR